MSATTLQTLDVLIRARYPILAIPSYEEERVEAALAGIARRQNKRLLCWTVTRGTFEAGAPAGPRRGAAATRPDPLAAIDEVMAHADPALFLFKDFHPYLAQPEVVRKLRDLAEHLRGSYKTLVLVSPHVKVPADLEKDVTVVDFPLPGLPELHQLLASTVREVNEKTALKLDPSQVAVEPLLRAALGLTLKEAENVFARALVLGGRLTEEDVRVVLEEKQQVVRKAGLLEYHPAIEGFDGVGGLDGLKDWLDKRRLAFTERARAFGLPYPKGVLLVGVQGCGKSLCAKAVAGLWRQPLLRFDVGRVFAGTVGSSEENMRSAIAAAEAVAPAILWVDEIEKAFSGVESSSFSDGGTTARVFASFLTWLQEKRSPVFVIATANNIRLCPPELMRKGRLDEIFFVDLPDRRERREILEIHVRGRRRDPATLDLDALVAASEGFSGAEIEQAVVSALFDVYQQGTELSTAAVAAAFAQTVPLSRTMAEPIAALRAWADERARPASRRPGDAPATAARMGKVEL